MRDHRRSRSSPARAAAAAALLMFAFLVTAPRDAPAASPQIVPGELLVRFAPPPEGDERTAARAPAGTQVRRALDVPGLQLLGVVPGTSVATALHRLQADP